MKNKKFLLFLIVGFSYVAEAMESYGISLNKENKTIILDGAYNPFKTLVDGVEVVELESFRTEKTSFDWGKFERKEYTVMLENVNIHEGISINCLIWFMNAGFKVQLNPTSYISLDGLEDFITRVPVRNPSNFADLISLRGFPTQGGYSGLGRSDIVEHMLIEKKYTFLPK